MTGMDTTRSTGSVLVAIGTRKGLWLARSDDREKWALDGPHLLMTEVPSVAIDTRRGTPHLLAGARSEHWGPTVQHSDDLGRTWTEADGGAIVFPDQTGAALDRVWQLQPDTAERPEVVWAGCEPTSLWRSDDGGRTFSLVQGLWNHPHRPQWYPGFGGAAVHTVVPHPTDDQRVTVAMSTGGVYSSDDGGASWSPRNKGIHVKFMPDPYPEFGQCVHKVATAGPDGVRWYAQNHHGIYRSDDAGVSWQSIAEGLPADFGFIALGHPRESDTAWVVPLTADTQRVPPDGRLRVHRTADGGADLDAQRVRPTRRLLGHAAARRSVRGPARPRRRLRRHARGVGLRQRRRGTHVHDRRREPARRAVRARGRRPGLSSAVVVDVLLPGVLREHAGGHDVVHLELADEATVGTALEELAQQWPALGRRLRDDTGAVRRHVNLFVDGDDVRSLQRTRTPLRAGSVLHVLPSVAGG